MRQCAVKYGAGYMDYDLFEMYNLTPEQREEKAQWLCAQPCAPSRREGRAALLSMAAASHRSTGAALPGHAGQNQLHPQKDGPLPLGHLPGHAAVRGEIRRGLYAAGSKIPSPLPPMMPARARFMMQA